MIRNFVTAIDRKGLKIYLTEQKIRKISELDKNKYDCENEKWVEKTVLSEPNDTKVQPKPSQT